MENFILKYYNIPNNDISKKVSKSGDTMTGNLTLSDGNCIILRNEYSGSQSYATLYSQVPTEGPGYTSYYFPTEGWDVSRTVATREWVNSTIKTYQPVANKCFLAKYEKLVVCGFFGIDAYTYRSYTKFIPDSYSEFRPYPYNPTGICILYKSDSDNYIASVDITNTGTILITYKNSITSRGIPSNTGHLLYGNMAWITQ